MAHERRNARGGVAKTWVRQQPTCVRLSGLHIFAASPLFFLRRVCVPSAAC